MNFPFKRIALFIALTLFAATAWFAKNNQKQIVLDRGSSESAALERKEITPAASQSPEQTPPAERIPAPVIDLEELDQLAFDDEEELDETSAWGLPDRKFKALLRNPDAAAKFLADNSIDSLESWEQAQTFPPNKFIEGDMVGEYSGPLSGGKGKIFIRTLGHMEADGFKGRYILKIIDAKGVDVVTNLSYSRNMGNRMRVDPNNQALILNSHDDARFVVQMFRGKVDAPLIGNIYEKVKGTPILIYYDSFKAERDLLPAL